MTVKTVKDLINEGIEGRYVLVRSDFNVPLKDGVITDPGRIDASLPTLSALVEAGAKVVVMAHRRARLSPSSPWPRSLRRYLSAWSSTSRSPVMSPVRTRTSAQMV